MVAPVKNGEVLSPEAFDELPENEKQELINDLNLMQEEIEKAAKDLPNGKTVSAAKAAFCAKNSLNWR